MENPLLPETKIDVCGHEKCLAHGNIETGYDWNVNRNVETK